MAAGAAAPVNLAFDFKTVPSSPPQPVIKYCITMPIILETSQYRARPVGNCMVKKTNMSGISQSIVRLIDCCLGSAVVMVVIFC